MNGTTAVAELACEQSEPSPRRPTFAWRVVISIADTDQLRQLLAQCSLGDRRAFETLYRSVGPRLHGVALRFMGRADLAEEVLQESFVRIWNNASRYEAHLSAPLTWMINITRNQAIDQLRKHTCIVIVTHSMAQAARVSQRTAFFHLGKVVEYGKTTDIFTNPATLADDGNHPNAAGYDVIAGMWMRKVIDD